VRADRGAALLEVLAAVVVMAIAGISMLELVGTHGRAVTTLRARELELADEERLLTAYVLLSRVDLDRRLGEVLVGPYVVGVQRPEPALYRIAVRRPETAAEDLATVVYRQVPDHAR
jgi:hypothetical protein